MLLRRFGFLSPRRVVGPLKLFGLFGHLRLSRARSRLDTPRRRHIEYLDKYLLKRKIQSQGATSDIISEPLRRRKFGNDNA